MCGLNGDLASSSDRHNGLISFSCSKKHSRKKDTLMLTIQFIIPILLILILLMLIIRGSRKYDSVLKADVKRLRAENEALRKELLKRGIIEYV